MDFRMLIAGKSPAEVTDIVRNLVTHEVAQILSISPDRIEPGRSLHDLGMDSLMAVELALGLEQRFGIQLPVMMLNESPTAERVTTRIVEKLLGGTDDTTLPTGSIDTLVESLAKQHGETITDAEIEHIAEDARALVQQHARLIA
jgi:acyl carrier protein